MKIYINRCPTCGRRIRKLKYERKYCLDCKKEINCYGNSIRCHSCNSKKKRKVDWDKVYCYYKNNGNISKTAREFKITIYTVRYILNRIKSE